MAEDTLDPATDTADQAENPAENAETSEAPKEAEAEKLQQTVEISDVGPCKKHVKITVERAAIDERFDGGETAAVVPSAGIGAGGETSDEQSYDEKCPEKVALLQQYSLSAHSRFISFRTDSNRPHGTGFTGTVAVRLSMARSSTYIVST